MDDKETILYYDAMLVENTARVDAGLPSTAEYQRLNDLSDKIIKQFRQQPGLTGESRMLVPKEVHDFMEAFGRYNDRKNHVV